MAGFHIKIDFANLEKQVKRISMPNAGRKIVQRAFQLSFDKAWKLVLDEELPESDFLNDLESGVIAAIFGFTPSQQEKQVQQFKELFRKKSTTVLVGEDVVSEISINEKDIGKLRVRHQMKKGGTIEFRWLEILINGLTGDSINAGILENIGVDEYVESDSIIGSMKSGLAVRSRSGHAIMTRGSPAEQLAAALGIADIGSFQFKIIPHPFLLQDIFGPIEDKLAKAIRRDFDARMENIPPIVIE
jgi:hypothetical protein